MRKKLMKVEVVGILILLFIGCGVQSGVKIENWSRWKGPNGDGSVQTDQFNPAFLDSNKEPVWYAMIGDGYSSLSIYNGRIYTVGRPTGNASQFDYLYCMDGDTGEKIWEIELPYSETFSYPGPRSTPVLDNGVIYYTSPEGIAMALKAKNGAMLWRSDLRELCGAIPSYYGISSSAEIVGDMILINACLAGVALNKKNGKVIWSTTGGLSGYTSPIPLIFNGESAACFIGNEDIFITRISDGEILDRYPWDNYYDVHGADPVLLDNNRIFISSAYGPGAILLDYSSGRLNRVWGSDVLETEFSNIVTKDGILYAIDGDTDNPSNCYIKAIHSENGELLWQQKIFGYASLILINETLVVLDENGKLMTVEARPDQFIQISESRYFESRRVARTPPTYAGGRLYLRSNFGEVLCLDVE